jgi:hypothetical protein
MVLFDVVVFAWSDADSWEHRMIDSSESGPIGDVMRERRRLFVRRSVLVDNTWFENPVLFGKSENISKSGSAISVFVARDFLYMISIK